MGVIEYMVQNWGSVQLYAMVYYLVSYENYIMVNVQMKIEFSKNSQIFFPRRDK